MKKVVLTTAVALFALSNTFGQSKEDKQRVKETIVNFAKYADQQNANEVDKILDPNYIAFSNRLFGSKEVSLTDKTTYLKLLSDKKIGGDKRKVTILSVDITEANAAVKVQMDGEKMKFTSYILLARDENGIWTIVGDMPYIS